MNPQEARAIQTINRADGLRVALERQAGNIIEDALPGLRALRETDRWKVTLEEVAPIRGNTLEGKYLAFLGYIQHFLLNMNFVIFFPNNGK